jgi:hypothetical protein
MSMWSISNFISRLARPVVSEVSTDSIVAFHDVDEKVFVAYIGPDDHATREIFAEVAHKYRDEFTFGLVSDVDLVKEQGSAPTVTCHLKDGGTVTRTSTSFTDSAALEKFVIEASRPVVGELTKYNQQRLLDVSATPPPARGGASEPSQASSGSTRHGLTVSTPAWMAHGLPICRDRRPPLEASDGTTQLC